MEEYSNSIPNLPTDILIEVFCRLPVKTLVKFSCVCKFWEDLIRSDRIFIRYHLEHSRRRRSSRNVFLYSDWSSEINGTQKHALKRFFINADENCLHKSFFLGSRFLLVGCINGVFCFYVHSSNNVYLCNPALHQCRKLPQSAFDESKVVAFFHEPTNDDYIVVKIDINSMLHIYKLSSNSWTHTNFPYRPSGKHVYIKDMVAVVHNGALHWLSYSYTGDKALFLNVYDLSRKRFRETLLLKLLNYIPFKTFEATLGLIKGCISILGRFKSYGKYEVWMMKEYGVKNSWTKQFVFPSFITPLRYPPAETGRSIGKFVVKLMNYVVLYDLETEEIEFTQGESILYVRNMEYFFTDNYVESLVSVFSPVKSLVSDEIIKTSVFLFVLLFFCLLMLFRGSIGLSISPNLGAKLEWKFDS